MIIVNTLGLEIKKARAEKDMTQQQLADALGVSQQAIVKWENGSAPSVENYVKLQEILGPLPDPMSLKPGFVAARPPRDRATVSHEMFVRYPHPAPPSPFRGHEATIVSGMARLKADYVGGNIVAALIDLRSRVPARGKIDIVGIRREAVLRCWTLLQWPILTGKAMRQVLAVIKNQPNALPDSEALEYQERFIKGFGYECETLGIRMLVTDTPENLIETLEKDTPTINEELIEDY